LSTLDANFYPPGLHGTAQLAAHAYRGDTLPALLERIGSAPSDAGGRAAWLMDRSLAHSLCFRPAEAAALQAEALSLSRVFRLRGVGSEPRLLAFVAPGDLMMNAPLDFLTRPTGVRLDLVFLLPDEPLPDLIPDHDIAIVAASESAAGMLDALSGQLGRWPRPVLNDPARIRMLSRDWLAGALAGRPGLTVAPTVRISRAALERGEMPVGYPALLRPLESHAGHDLMRVAGPADLAAFLATVGGDAFFATRFIEYRGRDGWYRKYRVAFIDRVPFLCHMAASERWMVHYLNAGMDESPAKRLAEAQAMAEFRTGFAAHHAAAFAGLCDAIGLDYFSIDCTEAPDGRLIVFEADVAAIVHSMDSPDLYPYKPAAMQRCYEAFASMLWRRSNAITGRRPMAREA
jgi:hypothetical protein